MTQFALKTTQASLNQTALEWAGNMDRLYTGVEIAAKKGADICTTHELSATGYECNDLFQGTDNLRIYDMLCNVAAYTNELDPNLMVSVGHPWRLQLREAFANAAPSPDIVKNALYDRLNQPFNVQTLIGGGRILGMMAKSNLYRNERGYENRYFSEWSFRDAEEFAKLAGIKSTYGTIKIPLPDGKTTYFGRPLIYVTDEEGHNFIYTMASCEEKWVATKYDGFPYDDSRYEQLNIIPSISRYLGSKKGIFLEVADASPQGDLKINKHIYLNNRGSQYVDVLVNTDGLGSSGSAFLQDGHRLISQNGKTISSGERLNFSRIATTTSTVKIHSADPALETKAHTTFKCEFKNAKARRKTSFAWNKKAHQWDHPDNPDRGIEEKIRKQALWTYDYMRKVGSTVSVNALSGGQDSSYNCVMDYLSIAIPMQEYGVEQVCDDLNVPYKDEVMKAYRKGGKEAALEAFMDNYLFMYYFPTNNNIDAHENAARTLSQGGFDKDGKPFKGIGGKFIVRSVQDLVTMSAFVFGTKNTANIPVERRQEIMLELSTFVHASPDKYTPAQMQAWADRIQKDYPELEALTSAALPGHSIAYENFQARLRTVLIWAAANIHGGMPRANPVNTEIYTNNTTAAGDMHGGAINPNGHIFKDDEQKILKYLEEKGLHGVVEPIKALHVTNSNKPSAGLLPLGDDGELVQNDEDTMQGEMPQFSMIARLMHHNKIPTDNGEREMNVGEVYRAARKYPEFDGLDTNKMFNTVINFYRRWYSGQFKIHMGVIQQADEESVDHQITRRTPNVSGAQKDEIIQLGIDLLFDWAKRDNLGWSDEQRQTLRTHAWNEPLFVKEFFDHLWNKDENLPNMYYNLEGFYKQLQEKGWEKTFSPPKRKYRSHSPVQPSTLEA